MGILVEHLLIFILVCLQNNSEHIIVEHIGESDKPIFTLVISQDRLTLPNSINYIVEKSNFIQLSKIIHQNKGDKKAQSNGFGSFKIIIKNKNNLDIYYYSREKSIKLFEKVSENLHQKGNNNLKLEIDNLIKRISTNP